MTAQAANFGCNTYSYVYSERADRCIARLMDFGFREFEPMVHPGHLWPASPKAEGLKELQQILNRGGGRITTLNMPNIDINVAAMSEDMRAYSLEVLEGVVRLAGELGAAEVVVGPGKANPLLPASDATLLQHFFAALDRLAPLAKQCGIALWAENMPFAFLPKIDALLSALDRLWRCVDRCRLRRRQRTLCRRGHPGRPDQSTIATQARAPVRHGTRRLQARPCRQW